METGDLIVVLPVPGGAQLRCGEKIGSTCINGNERTGKYLRSARDERSEEGESRNVHGDNPGLRESLQGVSGHFERYFRQLAKNFFLVGLEAILNGWMRSRPSEWQCTETTRSGGVNMIRCEERTTKGRDGQQSTGRSRNCDMRELCMNKGDFVLSSY